jgi:group I intron endonuclease
MTSGIYKIVNITNGHTYIGSAISLNRRWNLHRCTLSANKHHSRHLQNAWNKYGADMFKFVVLEVCDSDVIISREQYYIDDLKPEYNMLTIAGSLFGFHHSEETKDNMSKKVFSKETREKISKAKKGHTMSVELVEKLRKLNTGKKLRQETRDKMSESRRGKHPSEETRLKMSKATKAQWTKFWDSETP